MASRRKRHREEASKQTSMFMDSAPVVVKKQDNEKEIQKLVKINDELLDLKNLLNQHL